MVNDNAINTPQFDKVDPLLCINAKLRRLHRLIAVAYETKLKCYGLHGSMLSIMFIIGKNRHISQKAVADMLLLDQSTLSRDLKKLAEKKWISISKGDDSRYSVLELTEIGYKQVELVSPEWTKIHNTVSHILGSFQIQQIDNITIAIKNSLKEITN